MDNLLTAIFEAHCDERNHHRCYEIRIGRDLFSEWSVSFRFGRAGQHGTEQRCGGPAASALQKIVRKRLGRRLSAPRRIGCAYRLTSWSVVPGLDVREWLPDDLAAALSDRADVGWWE
ncbi:MAG TPA: WGR domain-containing protein, partial [Pirellulales bacterium]